jgi:uracil phosphoribosyltransferase
MPGEVHVITHPLVQHKLTLLRQKELTSASFRGLVAEISMLLAYELTRDLPVSYQAIETPLAKMVAPVVDPQQIVLVAILRAGTGILDGMLSLIPTARVGHIGIYRDPETLGSVEYYSKLPEAMEGRDVIVMNPLLATGNSAIAAVDRVKGTRPKSVKFVCLVASREGAAAFHEAHPDVAIYTAAVDEALDEHGFIVPGIGDAGDRLFGTK